MKHMNKHWKTLGREVALGSKWYRVYKETVELPSGLVLNDFYVRDSASAVLIVAHTVDDKYIMTKQYKHGAQQVVLEFPAGKIDEGEEVLDAAKRELREETGSNAGTLTLGPTFFEDPTNSRGKVYVVFAEAVEHKHAQDLDETEAIDLIILSRDELLKALQDGQIQVGASAAAGYMALWDKA